MYPVLIFHVISIIFTGFWAIIGCMKSSKKNREQKVLQSTPIAYESDPAALEKEKMCPAKGKGKTKRQPKMTNSDFQRLNELIESRAASKEPSTARTTTIGSKETPSRVQLPEDITQPSYSDESNEQKTGMIPTNEDVVMDRTFTHDSNSTPDDTKTAQMKLKTDSENIGDIKLVNHVNDHALKNYQIKKMARDAANQKQLEEALMRKLRSEDTASPDDTLKNVSSIQFESQISMVQRKKIEKDLKELKTSSECHETQGPHRSETNVEPSTIDLHNAQRHQPAAKATGP